MHVKLTSLHKQRLFKYYLDLYVSTQKSFTLHKFYYNVLIGTYVYDILGILKAYTREGILKWVVASVARRPSAKGATHPR